MEEGIVALSQRRESLITLSPDGSRNPWRFIVKGSLSTDETGTWLRGSVGPSSATQIKTGLWLCLMVLFLVSGLVSLIANVASGRGAANLSLILGSLVLITLTFLIVGAATRNARQRWNEVESHLRDILSILDVS